MHGSIFTVHTVCFTEISILSQTYQIKLSSKKENFFFSKHINLFIKKRLEEELSTRNAFFLRSSWLNDIHHHLRKICVKLLIK